MVKYVVVDRKLYVEQGPVAGNVLLLRTTLKEMAEYLADHPGEIDLPKPKTTKTPLEKVVGFFGGDRD